MRFLGAVVCALSLGCLGTVLETGSDGGDPSDAATDAGADTGDGGAGGDAGPTFRICPAGVTATFSSINTNLFQVSCGTGGAGCHSSAGAMYSGGLDLQANGYAGLVNAPGNNIAGSATGLIRVKPRDPANSFLLIKLITAVGNDPQYGSGMPFSAPGQVCPAVRDTIAAWIDAGAPNN
jgi:hypothetical protein